MDDKRKTLISKFLSKHLRHTPAEIGLTLEPGGWVAVDALLAAADTLGPHHPRRVGRGRRDQRQAAVRVRRHRYPIRANQGHTADVELALDRTYPSAVFFHGTAEQNLDSILQTGLLKMRRHHVHLSADTGTAAAVGARHGKVVILAVAVSRMSESGFEFYLSANGVWLVDAVPPEFLSVARRE